MSKKQQHPILVAHRGYASRYPENTIESVNAAVAAGACYVELDLQLSRDGVPYLLHDASLLRTGDLDRLIYDLDSDELDVLSVNYTRKFGSQFHDVKLPRLEALAERVEKWPQTRFFIEIKRQSVARFGAATTLAHVMARLEPVRSSCIIISFVEEVIEHAKAQYGMEIGWVFRKWSESNQRYARKLQPNFLFCNHKRLPPVPAELWSGPWVWVIYEVTHPGLAIRLAQRGATMIETMAIGELVQHPGFANG